MDSEGDEMTANERERRRGAHETGRHAPRLHGPRRPRHSRESGNLLGASVRESGNIPLAAQTDARFPPTRE